jgi:hypothetical protein
MIRGGTIELTYRRKAIFTSELDWIPAANGGNPLTHWNGYSACANSTEEIFNGRCRLNRSHIVAGPKSRTNEVHVRVEETRDNSTTFKVDHLCSGCQLARLVADGHDSPTMDQHTVSDGTLIIQRDYFAVNEKQRGIFTCGLRSELAAYAKRKWEKEKVL